MIQPYVQIIVRGHPADERDYTTKVVPKVTVARYFYEGLGISESLMTRYEKENLNLWYEGDTQ